jgi:autotransporter passenger strand-loop-strand repeat protein
MPGSRNIYGTSYVFSGQYDVADVVENSGTLVVATGGQVEATNVWGTLDVSGGFARDTILHGGTLNVGNGYGGSDYYTQVTEGGVLNVTNLGSSDYANVYNGSEHVGSGGNSYHSTIYSGSTMTVDQGGYAWNTTVNSATMTVDHGGYAANTTINSGIEYVYGLDVGTTLSGGSMQVIEAGGVSGYAHAEGYNNGVLVEAGGTASGVTLDTGSWMYVAAGGKADVVKFAGPNASETFGAWKDSAGEIVLGFGISDVIDFRGMVAGPGTKLTCTENAQNTAAVLTLTDAIGQTTSLTLMGQYSATQFAAKFDGAGGIAVTDQGLSLGSLGGKVLSL